MSQKAQPRNLRILKSPSGLEMPVFELHGTKDDRVSEGWLAAAIKVFLPRDASTFSQPAASAFARTSACCIVGCHNRVEVGAHVTVDGRRLMIIPTCKAHNGVGVLDKLKGNARLKRNTVYLALSMPKGKRIKNVDGEFYYDVTEPPEDIMENAAIFDTLEDDDDL